MRRNHYRYLLSLIVLCALFSGLLPFGLHKASAAVPCTWEITGSMASARTDHTATILPNGKVLVTGGRNGTAYLSSSELYTPTGKGGFFTPAGIMVTNRDKHTATLLQNGKVLIAGGRGGVNGWALSSAEIYDPLLGVFSATGAMGTKRLLHTLSKV